MELSNDMSVLKDLVMSLLAKVEALESENAALWAENVSLRSRLKLNGKNSHKPPSSDGLSKKPGLPQEPPKKSGGQLGHKGKTLEMVDKADHVVVHHATSCPCCPKVFSTADVVEVVQKRQVFDTPTPSMEVTEHQLGVVACCGRLHRGSFPPEVGQPVQYGSRIKALSVLLNNDYKLPLEKIEQLFAAQGFSGPGRARLPGALLRLQAVPTCPVQRPPAARTDQPDGKWLQMGNPDAPVPARSLS